MRRILALAACFTLYLIPLSALASSPVVDDFRSLAQWAQTYGSWTIVASSTGLCYVGDCVSTNGAVANGMLTAASSTAVADVALTLAYKTEVDMTAGVYVCLLDGNTGNNDCVNLDGYTANTWSVIAIQSESGSSGNKEFRIGSVVAGVTTWGSWYYPYARLGGSVIANTESMNGITLIGDETAGGARTFFDELNNEYIPPTASQITSIVSPIEGSMLTDNNVSFQFWYNTDCTASSTPYDLAGFNVQDDTVPQNIQGTIETTTCGLHLYQHTFPLTDQHTYTWTPFLYSTTASTTIEGASTNFSINTSGVAPTVSNLPGGLQGLWNLIQNNPPFGFIFQLRAQLHNLSATSTAAVSIVIPDFEKNSIFSPLDTGMAGLIYFFLAVWAFERFRHFEF